METINEKVLPVDLEEEIQRSYLDYSMSVIVGRALPDSRDGLKPVHRRILFTMRELGLLHNRAFKKSARVVGDVLGKYHPHGDTAVYDAMVRMVQSFSLRYPLLDGQGNYGSVDGDSAAAMRYTEVRLKALAEEMLSELDMNTVDFTPNYDESLMEPAIMPSRFPNLLVNGSSGIAVGMATNIPPHNLEEVIDAICHVIDKPDASIDELMMYIKGPDFPTGGVVVGVGQIREMYQTGRGLIRVRAKAEIEEQKNGKECIIVTEIPYTVNKSSLIEKIAELVSDKKITGISDLRDESDKDGMRIVIELKKGEFHQVILNQLYKHTQMETTFGSIMLALDGGYPKIMNLREILDAFINFRKETIIRRCTFELEEAQRRAHILEGFRIALKNIDEVIRIIKESLNRQEAKAELVKAFNFSEAQVDAILEMRLYQLTGLETQKLEEEYASLVKKIEELSLILGDERRVLALIKNELKDLKKDFSDQRRTVISPDEKEINIEDLIPDEKCAILVSEDGYIKRVPVTAYRQQRRGGVGVMGMETKEEDVVKQCFITTTHAYVLFFTSYGRAHWLKAYEVPHSLTRHARGKAIVNILALQEGEEIAAMIASRDFNSSDFLLMVTQNGIVKKTPLSAFSNPRKGGIIAINLDEGDKLIKVCQTSGVNEIILVTRKGQSIRFDEKQIRPTGRATRGVKGITIYKEGDSVVSADIVDEENTILVVSENGYGKRTKFHFYRKQNRGGKGIITMKTNERNGKVIGAMKVGQDDEILMTTSSGMVIRIKAREISVSQRNTLGVRLIRLREEDKLVSMAPIADSQDQEKDEENGDKK